MTASPRRLVIDMYSSRYPLWRMPDADVDRVRRILPDEWEVVRMMDEADGSGDGAARMTPRLRAAVEAAEVYCGFGIPPELFAAGDRLRWVHSGAAGVGSSLTPELRESGVIFTNSAAVHGVPVAEHALALMFFFARGFDRLRDCWAEGRWDREGVSLDDSPVSELTGATVGVIGCGGIGGEVARRAKGLGMRVLGTRRRVEGEQPEYVDRMFPASATLEVLAESDFVVLTVPHTPETDALIGAEELSAMKPDAVLINVARGQIVDEGALIEALQAGRIRGAGLDVFREEPLPESSPLWSLDNVCVTPHVAGISPRFWERETELIVENTRRYLAGQPLLNVVDLTAGY